MLMPVVEVPEVEAHVIVPVGPVVEVLLSVVPNKAMPVGEVPVIPNILHVGPVVEVPVVEVVPNVVPNKAIMLVVEVPVIPNVLHLGPVVEVPVSHTMCSPHLAAMHLLL